MHGHSNIKIDNFVCSAQEIPVFVKVTDLLDQLRDCKFLKKMSDFRIRFNVNLKTRKCFPKHSFKLLILSLNVIILREK